MTVAELRLQNAELARRLADAEQALAAFARGEVDAVAADATGNPTLLHAAQAQLRDSRQLLRAIFDGALDAIMLADDDGVYVDVNPAACQLFGMPREQLIGRSLQEFLVPSADGARGALTGLFPIHRPDGTRRTLDALAVANVVPGRHLSILRDSSARVASEDALHRSRDQLEEAQALAHLGRWDAGVELEDEITWSTECARIFGIAQGVTVAKSLFLAHVHAADRAHVRRALAELVETDAPYDVEHRVQWPDGTIRWVHARGVVDRDVDGRACHLHGTIQDITDRQHALVALRASEERYRRIVDNTADGVWMYDANSITTFMNVRMAGMLGYADDEVVGMSVFAFIDPTRLEAARERVHRRRRGIAERSNLVLRRKDGSELWTSVQVNPLFDDEGRFEGALALASDVSAERRADESRAHLAAIVESSADAIISASPSGTITSWNLAAEKLYQYSADEMIGSSVLVMVPLAERAAERSLLERVARGEASGTSIRERRRKDGTPIEVAITISPVRNVAGAVIGVSKIVHDLTSRRAAEAALKRSEDQLRQAQKMEAVGRLAGGVAHDFNNLLSVILSYAEFALDDLKPGDPLRDDMLQIDQAGRRATELTSQLLAFSRQQVLQPRIVDLAQIIASMDRMLRRLLGEDIALGLIATAGGGRVLADPGQLEQVVMNLAVNARDAMPEGGSLTIETADVRVDALDVGLPAGIPSGDYVMLAMSDTGMGMDAATTARIFEPFFTTKPLGKGTGLGLSTVFGIVRQSDGYIGVASEPGRGTTFSVYLPRTDGPVAAVIADEVAASVRGSETILLVEDEEQVRIVAAAILRRSGYNVLETSNGGEAFLVSKGFPARIHLLLTDVVMPRMSGRQLVEELGPQRPGMKVLYASGYTDDAVLQHGVLAVGLAFIQKPFTPQALLRKVREVLGPARPVGTI